MRNPSLQLNQTQIEHEITEKGYAIVSNVFDKQQCTECIGWYDQPSTFRKTIDMARYRFGSGEYKYFTYPLPHAVDDLRKELYQILQPLANAWNRMLKSSVEYPLGHEDFISHCKLSNQVKPTPLLLKYTKGCYNTLHQDVYGAVYFPFQAIISLSDKHSDYSGGELVLTEQRPRAQSKAIVLKPEQGDVVILPTNFRPISGTKGYYKVNMKHGVAEVLSGERFTLGIIFHDAQ